MAVLQQIIDGRPCQVIELSGRYVLIGRDERCDVVIECKVASRRHAQIEIDSDHFYLKDLQSRNGTLVNGRRITQIHVLHDGDEIVISKSIFRFLKTSSGAIQHSPNPAHVEGYYIVPEASSINDDSIQHEDIIQGQLITRAEMNTTPVPRDKIIGSVRFPEDMTAIAISGDQNGKLRLLLQGLAAFRGSSEAPSIFARAAELLLAEFRQFETVILVRRTEQPEGVEVVAAMTRLNSSRIEFAGSLVSTAMAQKSALLVQDHWRPTRSHQVAISSLTMHTLLSCPMMLPGGEVMGAIQLEASHSDVRDIQILLERLITFSILLSATLELSGRVSGQRARPALDRTTDTGLSGEVYGGDRIPRVPGYKIFLQRSPAAENHAAHVMSLCLDKTRVAAVLVETEVRSSESGLLSTCMRNILIQTLRDTGSAMEAIRATEQSLREEIARSGTEVSVAIAILDCRRGTVVVSMAGSCPVLLATDSQAEQLEQPESTTSRLGASRLEYRESEVGLRDGDSIVILSEATAASLSRGTFEQRHRRDVREAMCECLQLAAQVPETIDLRLADELTKRSQAGTLKAQPVFLIMHRCEVPSSEFSPSPALTEP